MMNPPGPGYLKGNGVLGADCRTIPRYLAYNHLNSKALHIDMYIKCSKKLVGELGLCTFPPDMQQSELKCFYAAKLRCCQ